MLLWALVVAFLAGRFSAPTAEGTAIQPPHLSSIAGEDHPALATADGSDTIASFSASAKRPQRHWFAARGMNGSALFTPTPMGAPQAQKKDGGAKDKAPAKGTSPAKTAKEREETCRKLDVFAQVLHYVQASYVEPVEPTTLIHAAIKGMLDTLDSHSVFLPPDLYREMKLDTSGEFQGLGVIIEQDESGAGIVIVSTLEGSPAAEAGVKAGDLLVKVDGADVAGMSIGDITRRLRGAAGSTVRLTLRRAGRADPLTLSVVRQTVRVKSVEARLLDADTGYVRIRSFQERTAQQLDEAISALENRIQAPLAGLVLDLRDNPGGLFEQGVRSADLFLEKGDIVSTRGRNPHYEEVEKAHAPGTRGAIKLAVLIDDGTASAAEILAGALQDQGRAVLVGERSFGKGSVQNVIDLDDGSGLKLTVAHYYTPKRRNIHKVGIEPDRSIPPALPAHPTADLARLVAPVPGVDIPPTDAQAWAAWRLLKEPRK